MGQPVVHFEIMARDAKRARDFYGELFGWRIDADNPMGYGFVERAANLDADGMGIGGGIGQMPPGHDGHVTFYVSVPDLEASLADAARLGATRLLGPDTVMPGLTIGLFADGEGRVVGVMHNTQADA